MAPLPPIQPTYVRTAIGPINVCIYCGDSKGPLTDEHIVPLGIGGRLELLKSSCRTCQVKYFSVENNLLNHSFLPARRVFGLKGRSKRSSLINFTANNSKKRYSIPVSDFPVYYPLLRFQHGLPTILSGVKKDFIVETTKIILFDDTGSVIDRKLLAMRLTRGDIVKIPETRTFCRLLAKIGHAYASAM